MRIKGFTISSIIVFLVLLCSLQSFAASLEKATVRIILSQKKDASMRVTQTGVFLKDDQGEVHLLTALNGVLMLVDRPNPIEKLNISIYNNNQQLVYNNQPLRIRAYDVERDLISLDLSTMNYSGPAVEFHPSFMPAAPCGDDPDCDEPAGLPDHYSLLGYGDGKPELNSRYRFTHQRNTSLKEYLAPNELEAWVSPVIPSVHTPIVQGVANHNLYGFAGSAVVNPNTNKPFGIVVGAHQTAAWIVPIALEEFVPTNALNNRDLELIQQQIQKFQQLKKEQHINYCFEATNFVRPVFSRKGWVVDPNDPFDVIALALVSTNSGEQDHTTYVYTAANLVDITQDTYYGKDNTKEIKRGDKEERYGDYYNSALFNLILGKYYLLEYRRANLAKRRMSKIRGNLDQVLYYYDMLKGIYNENENIHLFLAEKKAVKKNDLDLTEAFNDFFNAVRCEADAKTAHDLGVEAEQQKDYDAARAYYCLALSYESCYARHTRGKLAKLNERLLHNVELAYGALHREQYDSALSMLTASNALLKEDSIDQTIAELEAAFNKLVEQGDESFQKNKLSEAMRYYQEALDYKRDQYVQDQLWIIDGPADVPFEKRQLVLADRYYRRRDFQHALFRYQQAQQQNNSATYVQGRIDSITAYYADEERQLKTIRLAQAFQNRLNQQMRLRSGMTDLPNCYSYYNVTDTSFTLVTSYGMETFELVEDTTWVENFDNFSPGEVSSLAFENFLYWYAITLSDNLEKHGQAIDPSTGEFTIEGHVDAIKFERNLQYDKKLYANLKKVMIIPVDTADTTVTFKTGTKKLYANRGLAYLRAYRAQQILRENLNGINEEDVELLIQYDRVNYGEDYRKVVIRYTVYLR